MMIQNDGEIVIKKKSYVKMIYCMLISATVVCACGNTYLIVYLEINSRDTCMEINPVNFLSQEIFVIAVKIF